MSDYTKGQNFTAMAGTDSLPAVFDTEFNAVATASATKADKLNPTLSGTVVIPALAAAVSHAGDALKTSPAQSNEIYMHAFPTGTKMAFFQATAPIGWTQDTTHNDALLRVVSGATGGNFGGTDGFVATPLASTAGHALTVAEMPAHTHTYNKGDPSTATQGNYIPGAPYYVEIASTTGSTGGSTAHAHNITFAPKYIDMIIATKD